CRRSKVRRGSAAVSASHHPHGDAPRRNPNSEFNARGRGGLSLRNRAMSRAEDLPSVSAEIQRQTEADQKDISKQLQRPTCELHCLAVERCCDHFREPQLRRGGKFK